MPSDRRYVPRGYKTDFLYVQAKSSDGAPTVPVASGDTITASYVLNASDGQWAADMSFYGDGNLVLGSWVVGGDVSLFGTYDYVGGVWQSDNIISYNGTNRTVLIGNDMTWDANVSLGAGQDNYVATYNHSTGLIGFEAAAGGGGSPEGTSVLSTGEVGGTKFLREDGDGTCSWQAVGAGSEVNDLTASVTWANIPDANVPESAVTQHEAALTIIESQITGAAFTNWNTAFGWGDHAGLYGTAAAAALNTAKVTNATHTGDVTGDTALTIAAGAVDIAMMSASGTADATTFLRGDNTWAAPAGGSAYLVHIYVTDETSLVDTNAPLARRFFRNTHRDIMLLDLSNFTQCRLVVNKQTVAGAAAYQLSVEYRAAGFSTSVANYVDIGTSVVSCACNVTNTVVDSGWINLAAGAIADSVAVCVTSEGGDGVLDPQFGKVVIQFR